MKQEKQQTRDELGFTFDDYEHMHEMQAYKGLQGDTLLDGYDVTKEQIQAINERDRFAIDMFFYVNEKRIRRLASIFCGNTGILFPRFSLPCSRWTTVSIKHTWI